MTSRIRSISLPGLALIMLVGGWIAHSSLARRPMQAARQPTVVAVVRLSQVFDGLAQIAKMEQDLGAIGAANEAEADERKIGINKLEDELEDETDAQRIATLQDDLNMMKLRFGAWSQMVQREQDIEIAIRLESAYMSIRDAARQLALAEGIDLILFDNSSDTLMTGRMSPKIPREAQVYQRIDEQRLLYARADLDVTDQLIQRMNNSFRLGANTP